MTLALTLEISIGVEVLDLADSRRTACRNLACNTFQNLIDNYLVFNRSHKREKKGERR
jgi:hypothetical protein